MLYFIVSVAKICLRAVRLAQFLLRNLGRENIFLAKAS